MNVELSIQREVQNVLNQSNDQMVSDKNLKKRVDGASTTASSGQNERRRGIAA